KVEPWVAQEPEARSGWVEGFLWACELAIGDVAETAPTNALNQRQVEAWNVWWHQCLRIWSRHAPETDRELRREAKCSVSPFTRGNHDIYLSGFRRGVLPDGQPIIHGIL